MNVDKHNLINHQNVCNFNTMLILHDICRNIHDLQTEFHGDQLVIVINREANYIFRCSTEAAFLKTACPLRSPANLILSFLC
jgi:hypothetical protein